MKLQLSLLGLLATVSLSSGKGLPGNEAYSQKPAYTENKGQIGDQDNKPRPDVLFSGSTHGMVYHLRDKGISYQFNRVDRWKEEKNIKFDRILKTPELSTLYRLDLDLQGSNTSFTVRHDEALPGYDTYYKEVCPNGVTQVKTYTGVTYENIYNQVDLHYYEKDGDLKYDYLVAAGADYRQIQIQVKGAENITIGNKGELMIETPLGIISEPAPLVMQDHKTLKAKWIIKDNVLSFEIAGADPAKSLVIDPIVRAWGTYYGNGDSEICGTVTDASGNVYISGYSANSSQLIATSGSHQSTYGGDVEDAFLVKFNTFGTRLWGTYYGGNGSERGYGCAVDPLGNVYMAGESNSQNAIATAGSHQTVMTGQYGIAFLAKFDAAGVRLWGTYYGGTVSDQAFTCTTDASGNVFLAGQAFSSTGIATPGSYQQFISGFGDGFLAKFNSSGVRQWGTYYGGLETVGSDAALACAADPSGNIYLCGTIAQNINIGTPGSFQPTFLGGEQDGYLAKFDGAGAPLWATHYGCTTPGGPDEVRGCVTDVSGNVYIAGVVASVYGFTTSPLPPVSPSSLIATPGTHQPLASGSGYDAYLVKFDASGARQWGTYFGENSRAYCCAIDPSGNLYIGGYLAGDPNTLTTNTTVLTPGCQQPVFGGITDAYVAKFNSAAALQYATFYGGVREETANSCAVDPAGNFYLAGFTTSYGGTSIATPGSQQPTYGGPLTGAYANGFLTKFANCAPITSGVTQVMSCAGNANGSATVNASANGSQLTYSWLPGGTTSSVISGLGTGTYSCIITSSCGVTSGETVAIVSSPQINLTVLATTSLLCAGNTGTLSANGTGGTGSLTYSWSNGAIANSATTATIHPSALTVYSVTATDANGCATTETVTQKVSQCLGITSLAQDEVPVIVYPNPAHDEFTIESGEMLSIKISNSLGQQILFQQLPNEKSRINVDGYAKGIYFVEVTGKQYTKTIKLIKE